MNQLPQRERLILRLRFGIEDGTCHTLGDVGKQLDISGQRVRQLEQKALKKLRQLGVKFGLEDFLD
jgi:RNA polymerase sigma factor (sigma-70 family)